MPLEINACSSSLVTVISTAQFSHSRGLDSVRPTCHTLASTKKVTSVL